MAGSDRVAAAGEIMHVCEGDYVCKSLLDRIPQFNAFMYLENISQVGKIDEVFGPVNNVMFTVKPSEGFTATSFKPGDKFFIAPDKTLALDRFLPKPYVAFALTLFTVSYCFVLFCLFVCRGVSTPGGKGAGRGVGGRGGGRGMRIVWKPEDFEEEWNVARQEAGAAFGNDGMYLEKFIEEPRHIEIQIAGDQYGKACHLSERDCSIQRRHQKLLEETPSPFMTKDLREKMGEAAIKAALAVKYEGVGTVEFLVDKHRNFYFMEMNTRIQVEHPITEEVINYDLIKEQIKIASGDPISGKNYFPSMHAIECRINAEDPYNNFRPSPGRITNLHVPGGHGVRVDSHVYAGYTFRQITTV